MVPPNKILLVSKSGATIPTLDTGNPLAVKQNHRLRFRVVGCS